MDPSERLLVGSLSLVVLGFVVFYLVSPGVYLGDDAFISLTYADNLSRGLGPVFNEGERVWGYTSPLQTFLLAGVAAIGLDPVSWAAALSVAELGAAVLLLIWIVRPLVGDFAAVAALGLLLVPSLHLFPGLEGSLVVLLQLATLACLVRNRLSSAAFLAAMSCLARPDSILLVGPLLIARLGTRRLSSWAWFAGPGLLWLIFAMLYYGEWLPNTLGAKTNMTGFVEYVGESWRWLASPDPDLPRRNLALRLALVACNLSLVLIPGFRRRPALLYAFVVYPWILVLAYALIGAPHFHRWEIFSGHFFFTAGWMLGLAALLHHGIGWILRRTRRGVVNSEAIRLGSVPAIVSFCLVLALGLPRSLEVIGAMQSNIIVGARYHTYKAIAEWMDANVEGPASLGHSEVGTLGYYTERTRIVDLGGLVTSRPSSGRGPAGRAIIRARQPTHLLMRATDARSGFRIGGREYERVHRFPDYGYIRFDLYAR